MLNRIAIIGDYFVRASLFEEALQRELAAAGIPFELAAMEVTWPDVPLMHGAEVSEYVGDPEVVADLVTGAQALVTHVAPVTESVLARAPGLRVIGCCRGGPVNVNVAAASKRGIPVVNAPARNSQAVVEFTVGLLLAECRGIARAHAALCAGVWRGDLYRYDRTGRELRGQVIGLIGFGAIGQALVPYLKVFGMRVLAFDPYTPDERFQALEVERVDLPVLLRESDIVSLHARVTPETRGMMGRSQFAMMKRDAYFINTARGPLVDYEALHDALASGHLAGAGLDTFPEEPPPAGWPLLKLPNVTVTPHVGGSSQESARRGAEQVARDVANCFAQRPLQFCVNRSALDVRTG